MPRKRRRTSTAVRVESLEGRVLLNGASLGSEPWLTPDNNPQASFFVQFKSRVSTQRETAILQSVGATEVSAFPGGPTLASTSSPTARATAVQKLSSNPYVRFAEPDSTIHVDSSAALPNDADFSQQWGLNSANNVDIDAPQAWQVTTGSPSTIVAVIDSGIDLSHPEFVGRIWTNPNAYAPNDATPGDIHGWNFIDNSPDVQDDNGHGTHVSGIIAATGNNGIGVAGVDWNAQIMPLKFIDASGNGSVDQAVQAIYYAVDHGARVINASWGGGDNIQTLTEAIAYANAHNVVFVTAAGNDGMNNAVDRSYPADDRLPNVISVAAINQKGKLASFSDFGATTVDLAAPGVSIRSTVPGGYATYSGTSMAAPYVTGVVSLLVGDHPTWNAQQLVERVLATTKPLAALKGKTITGGIVDAYNAVNQAYAGSLSKKAQALKFPAQKTTTKVVKPKTKAKAIEQVAVTPASVSHRRTPHF